MRRERIAVVDKDKLRHKKDAIKICADACPINRAGKDCIYENDDTMVIDEILCIGCGICINVCPIQDAIKIVNLPAKLSEDPIHRYGENEFALYSLPTPMFGKVIGILGVNGIGKSTALKVLAGQIIPNFGKFDKSPDPENLVKYFKGTEAQKFFEDIRDKKINVSYKPQAVDLIPKQFNGKVRDLLEKVDEKKELEKISERLELNNLLDREVSQISGGELQRVAIAATVLKKANLYVFDEPTSYLDIKQRLKISEFIKELANEETAVLVVEHDLLILDHMTDLVHIMYGSEDVFGIVAQPRTTRIAMNSYLSGYLKEENVRIRDGKINFKASPQNEEKLSRTLISWEGVNKKLGSFSLHSEKGEIKKGEVVGVLGENGIGKTSFVKLLAKVEKPDSGKIDSEIKVSYKPQYLNTESEELVMTFLTEAQRYQKQLVQPLNLEPLFMKQLNQLSGGQLQRVSIAYCLSQNADLFLLDEPSAYLDVEQRLRISKVIKDFMEETGKSSLIVDHDLLFLDFISERLQVFDGEPARKGSARSPCSMVEGMNGFLKRLDISLRRDEESLRPRINKKDSVKDREQKGKGRYYY
jgi:ATP-binding cassette, sub-family E, member 1